MKEPMRNFLWWYGLGLLAVALAIVGIVFFFGEDIFGR